MAGYFTLGFDTTGPHIEIYAPKYTDRVSNNYIRIVSDEKLSSFQNIYVIDSKGVKHDVIFSFDGNNTLLGNIVFNDYPIGVTTIFAQLKDDVDNMSNLATAHISVITSTYNAMLRLTMSEEERKNPLNIKELKPIVNEKELIKSIYDKNRNISFHIKEKKNITNEKESIKAIYEKNEKVVMSEKNRITIVSDID